VDLEGNSIACYPLCFENTAIEVKVYPSTPVCDTLSVYSLSGPLKDATSSALVMASSVSNISPLERQALQDLYDSTDGPNWIYYYGWDFSNPYANPCDEHWYGVTCSADYHIISLGLFYKTGTIPSTIGQLSSLQSLYLNSNQLTGTIPSTIGQLSSLQYLYLYSNQLTGTIPSTIGQLSSLYYLYLAYNQLTGTIPSTIGQLSSLQGLVLNNNQLTGRLPSSLCQISVIYYFYFNGNLFECYPAFLRS